jgi:hypothetical protein
VSYPSVRGTATTTGTVTTGTNGANSWYRFTSSGSITIP